jgi:hypothetical protein
MINGKMTFDKKIIRELEGGATELFGFCKYGANFLASIIPKNAANAVLPMLIMKARE